MSWKIDILSKVTWNIHQEKKHQDHKTNLKFKWTGITSCISSDHNWIKLKINYRNITQKSLHSWNLKLISKQSMGQKDPKGKLEQLENILNWAKMKIQHIEICVIYLKQCLKRKLQHRILTLEKNTDDN